MLSQPYPKLELNLTPTQEDDFTKTTRLSEIRKGADFTRVVNDLANQQWRGSHVMPRIVEIEERETPQKGGPRFKFDEPQLLKTSTPLTPIPPTIATPLKPVSRHDSIGRGSSSGTASRELRNINSRRSSLVSSIFDIGNNPTTLNRNEKNNTSTHDVNTNNIIIHRKHTVLPNINGFRDSKSSIDLEELYFNTWGSRDLGLDSKLVPEKVPRVVVPKQYGPSSRVGSQNHGERHLRIETDFRSRNGLVKIVKPLNPLPPIAQFQYQQTDLVDDLENISREKTYITLKRIDQILNPQQAYCEKELNSSELEILGSGSSTPVAAKEKIIDSQRNSKQLKRKSSYGSYINHSGGLTVIHTYPNGHGKIQTPNTVPPIQKQSQSRSMSPYLKTLESEKITSYEKCLKWVDKCSQWY